MELTDIRNLKHMVDYAAKEFVDIDFMQYKADGGIAHKTYPELKKHCDAFSLMIEDIKLRGCHVAIIGPTSFEWVCTYLGTGATGSVSVPLAPAETDEMNCELINYADVTVLAFDEKHKSLYEQAKKSCNIKLFISLDNKSESEDVVNISDIFDTYAGIYNSEPEGDALCAIVFTSGTTGFPKGVMLSHKNLVWSATSVHVACPTKKMFSCLPIHHMFCFTANITKSICRGKTVCVNDNLANLVPDLRLFKPDSIVAVPQIVKKVMDGAMMFAKSKPEMSVNDAVQMFLGGNIIDVISGGAPLDAASNERYNSTGILVLNGYGMTECAPIISNNAVGSFRHGSVGKPIPCMDVKIVNGEIMCKGPSVMQGYYKNPEATAAAFDEYGYLHTGDIGHFDEDGFLYITGRCKNLILLDNGENVSAEMLEDLFGAEQIVKEVICFGEGGVICAEIFPDKQYAAVNGIDDIEKAVEDAIASVNSKVALYQRITEHVIREVPFERTSSSKIKRGQHSKLKEKPVVLPENENEEKVLKAVKDVLKLKTISMVDNFFAIGGNSLNAVELAVTLGINTQVVYDKPLLRSLAKELKTVDESVDDRIEGINDILRQTSQNHNKAEYKKSVLLTGATGFLGIHILCELISKGRKVICLVRDENKLRSQAEYYFGGLDFSDVECISGNICNKHFGLSDEIYNKLTSEIDCVYHVAANVHHSGDYYDLEKTNVNGTENVIEFCLDSGAVMQHTSTVSLHGAATCKQSRTNSIFDETILDIGQYYQDNVYIHSKYCAEQKVILARQKGLKANIYRIGNLTWRASDGKFQINSSDNGFMHRLKAMLKLGLYHKNMDKYPMDLTAVDECARAFVSIAELGYVNEVYHMYNPNYLPAKNLFECFDREFRQVSTLETIETMVANTSDADIHVYLFYMIISARSENIEMKNEFTVSRMAECNAFWSEPDREYMLLSSITGNDYTDINEMHPVYGVMNPVQRVIGSALSEAKAFDGDVIARPDSVLCLKEYSEKLEIKKPLIITIPEQLRCDTLKKALSDFENAVVFDDIQGEPSVANSDKVLSLYKDNNCDGVIAIGGGSVLDIAKVTSLRASNPDRAPEDICKVFAECNKAVKLIAVPTTAGTGSEATIFAVLKDSEGKKKAFVSDKYLPDVVILDPVLTLSLPAKTTAHTGMDALSHSIESYLSLFADNFPEDIAFCERAVRLISENLKKAVNHPDDADARFRLQQAAFYSGRAFGRISTGYIHAIAHRLGEIFRLPHGLAIAMCILPVIEAYSPMCASKIADLADFAGITNDGMSNDEKYNKFVSMLKDLISLCDLPKLDANDAIITMIAQDAQEEAKAVGSPLAFSDEKICEIVSKIING